MAGPRTRRPSPSPPVPDRHSALVLWDLARGHFRAWSPEVGLVAVGASAEEAVRDLEAQAARGSDHLPRRPARTMESFSGRLRVRLSRSLHGDVAQAAAAEGVSVNLFLLWLLEGRSDRRPCAAHPAVDDGPPAAEAPLPPYSAVIRWSERLSAFVASAPEVPDLDDLQALSRQGSTRGQALESLWSMIPLVLRLRRTQGLPTPRPRLLPASPGQLLLRLPPRLHRTLAETAEADGVSMNTHIESLVARGMGRRDEQTRRG